MFAHYYVGVYQFVVSLGGVGGGLLHQNKYLLLRYIE